MLGVSPLLGGDCLQHNETDVVPKMLAAISRCGWYQRVHQVLGAGTWIFLPDTDQGCPLRTIPRSYWRLQRPQSTGLCGSGVVFDPHQPYQIPFEFKEIKSPGVNEGH